MLKEKDLIPVSSRGEEIKERFNEFLFRKNPHEGPIAKALLEHGYEVKTHPLQGDYTDDDWLGSSVSIKGLTIVFRQPTLTDVLICHIKREGEEQRLNSALLGVMEFIAFCHYHCPEILWLGGCVEKVSNSTTPKDLDLDRLVRYYHRILGGIEGYCSDGFFWIYADMRNKERFETLPIWKRYQREKLAAF